MRLVADTNVLVSYLLIPGSIPGRAVDRLFDQEQLLVSDATMQELSEVLARPKFDRYVALEERQAFVQMVARVAVWVPIVRRIQICRDPRDDRFLELAVNGAADLILTGDSDLLALHPVQGIAIRSPAEWLKNPPATSSDRR